jgi:hypothetical protein
LAVALASVLAALTVLGGLGVRRKSRRGR